MSDDPNYRTTPTGLAETPFRRQVRDGLDLDLFTRDGQIFETIRKVKTDRAALLMALKTLIPYVQADEIDDPGAYEAVEQARATVRLVERR